MGFPIIVLTTATGCGPCERLKADGRLRPSSEQIKRNMHNNPFLGGGAFDDITMRRVLTADLKLTKPVDGLVQKFRFLNVNYESLRSDRLSYISEFSIAPKGYITQRIFSRTPEGKTNITIYTVTDIDVQETNAVKTEQDWDSMVKQIVPLAQTSNYVAGYPSFAIFGDASWQEALTRQTPLFGRSLKFTTVETSPFGIVRQSQNGHMVPVEDAAQSYNALEFIAKVASGQVSLTPPASTGSTVSSLAVEAPPTEPGAKKRIPTIASCAQGPKIRPLY